ncbi:MAG: acetylornithine aminotransferase [Pirellulaceae bacterium]|nr:MAG: acetylornithine aminotransferase [Pirellulaceae bacterium]
MNTSEKLASTMSSADSARLFERYVIGNYVRYPINLVRGRGSRVWDAEGREYLDFFPGWGCNLLGHCPPRVVHAVQEQVATLIHVPNTWLIDSQARWAQMLVERSFPSQAFFCNSGAEANEAAIKLTRLHQGPDRYRIITFQGGFHGRTFGALSATAQPKYHAGMGPMLPGFTYVPFGDLEAVERSIDDTTAGILIEPVQGEGGVRVPPEGFLAGLRQLADQHGLLLIFDEVQTGCGRTGNWFGFQTLEVQPDIITLAKSLCGGIAGGAMLARAEIAASLKPGTHASTFGGNPIAAAAGIATLETIEQEGLLERGRQAAERFAAHLSELQTQCPHIRDIRQVGLMIGIEFEVEVAGIVQRCLEDGLLINCTQGNILRLLPAMNVTKEEIDRGMEKLAANVRAFLDDLTPPEVAAPGLEKREGAEDEVTAATAENHAAAASPPAAPATNDAHDADGRNAAAAEEAEQSSTRSPAEINEPASPASQE